MLKPKDKKIRVAISSAIIEWVTVTSALANITQKIHFQKPENRNLPLDIKTTAAAIMRTNIRKLSSNLLISSISGS